MDSRKNGAEAALQRLLSLGAKAEGFAKDEDSALMVAAYEGHVGTVNLLLQHRADAATRNHFMKTPLMSACQRRKNAAIVLALLQRGADPRSRGMNGESAYLYAAR